MTYPAGTKQSAFFSDFKCGSDGTVFLPMFDDYSLMLEGANRIGHGASRVHEILLTGLTPSGDVVRFAYEGISGLRNFVPEMRYFLSGSRVYALEMADMFDPADPRKTLGRVHLILIYDYKGIYQGEIRLEAGLNPINIAAFNSGDVLVVSLDKLNQTTRLLIFDSSGRQLNELRLFDEDYLSTLNWRQRRTH
jgi:hypothetical protein